MDNLMAQQLLRVLKELGLKPNESSVYLALLSIGENAASTIAKKAGFNRCSCYSLIEGLIRKGFLGQITKNNIKYYIAVEPSQLVSHLKAKQIDLEKKINIIGKNILNIQPPTKKDHSERPQVVFFEGPEGLKNILEDTLTSKEEIRAYVPLIEINNMLPEYLPHYFLRRTQKKIPIRAIYPADEFSYRHKLRDNYELRKSKLIPPEFNFNISILIYDNKVAITSPKGNFSILIKNREIYESKKRIFEFIWEAADMIDKIMTKAMGNSITLKKAPPDNQPEPF